MRGFSTRIAMSVAAGALAAGLGFAPLQDSGSAESGPPDPSSLDDLTADLDEILAEENVAMGQASVVLQDAGSGDVLYEHNPGQRLTPATNQKLLTSVAALDVLGADHTFTTTVETAASQSGSVLEGDLYLRGGGDPTILAADYADLAGEIADAGVDTIAGDVLGDDSRYYGVEIPPDVASEDEALYYTAPVSALTVAPGSRYDAGTVQVEFAPGPDVGEPAEVTVKPESTNVTVENHATTVTPTTGIGITVARDHGSDVIDVRGDIDADSGGGDQLISVANPTNYALGVFVQELENHGVTVEGEIDTARTPDDASVLAEHESMPLSELLVPFLKLSNNTHAEVLINEIGHVGNGVGTGYEGRNIMESELAERYDVNVRALQTADGSGQSYRNLIPAAEIAKVLDGAQDRPWFDTWYEALPIAGEPEPLVGGALQNRMGDTAAQGNVHASAGVASRMSNDSALSGYVTDADGRDLVFSIMFNNINERAIDVEDRIAVRIAEHSEASGSDS